MTYEQFIAELCSRGFERRPHDICKWLVRSGPALSVDRDSDGKPTGIRAVARPWATKECFTFELEPRALDADVHFSARLLGEREGDDLVQILEEGPYYGYVFMNLHDDGPITTLEDLLDPNAFDSSWLRDSQSREMYAHATKTERIEWMPFFEQPVARSLDELFASLIEP